jgi:hypothetical protein
MHPTTSPDAHGGKQSILLDSKQPNRVYPLYFTVGVKHRLTMFLKADKEVQVNVRLGGSFDNKKVRRGADRQGWHAVDGSHTRRGPAERCLASLDVNITVPEGAKVLLDDVSFRPVEQK